MRIKDLPWFNRPASKLRRKGVESLDDAELLAILFGKGCKNESALELSNRLLKKYNWHKLGELCFNELKQECGNDYVKALRILSLVEINKRYNKQDRKGYNKRISSSEDVFNMFCDRFADEKQENFVVLYLDNKNNVIKEETISIGTLNASIVHPREVFKNAIKESANTVILVHNHPSGDCKPSKQDEEITKKLIETGKIIGIQVLDHVIIGQDKHYSFKDMKNLL